MSKRKLLNSAENISKKVKSNGHWANGLIKSMEDPKLIIKSDDTVTIIKDAYPKAEYHYLILPKENINSLKSVETKHVELLEYMDKVARELVSDQEHKDKQFRIGYHSEPSMQRLHLHIISEDMNSPCLKTKKHWNSFTSDFFLDSKDVITSLVKNGSVIIPSKEMIEKYMNLDLKCHKCDYIPKHMPDLKKHISSHF